MAREEGPNEGLALTEQINSKRSRRSQRGKPSVNSRIVSRSVKTLKESTIVIPSLASLTAVFLRTYTAPADMSFV